MFGYPLSHDQERAALELLGFAATANRSVTRDERQFIVDLSHDFNASAEGIFEIHEKMDLGELAEQFDEPTASRIALIYLIQLSFVDGLYESGEWLGVRTVGDALGVPDKEVAKLEEWVRRGLVWEEQGRELLGLPSKWTV